MIRFSHRPLAVVALGATLLSAGACNTSDSNSGAAGASASAASNTAEICKSSGEAARTAVMGLLGKIAVIAKGNDAPTDAEMTELYQSTFGALRDDLNKSSAEATDPEFAVVLKDIAAEAGKLATAADPVALGNEGFQTALGKLETHCPSDSRSSAAPSGAPGGAAGAAVGAKGSACELPVTFSAAEKWQPKKVEVDEGDPLAELARKGSLRMACEINGRPAGLTAFVRVWIDPKGTTARKALKQILTGAKTRKVTYAKIKLGGRDGVELSYQLFSELLEEYSDRQAFAVKTPGGVVVVELSGLGGDDPAVQAAYDLAKSTLTVQA
ncbi:lipoprotein [Actinoplanes aureus]|uniref:Lipoprotein n=1 Tax=Actinoplanes aureus TaxID=2792083 RepID=A0A931CFU1_9ACTN|nr:lipoprotein [Actinoplanes aureus]MBG0564115.1 hypothetical protein [Actinoplanes aureus]